MDPERLDEIEALYHSARERSPEARAELLEQADPELRREVESLLAQQTEDGPLDRPALEVAARLLDDVTQTRLTVGEQLGPYKIEAPIGAGGMARIYKARDTRLGRAVAIKISNRQFSERFEREAHAISALNHANICTLYDVGANYLVMELVEGETLAERVKNGALPMESVVRYGAQIADALAAAHAQGIIHRDLKPGNIIVGRGRVKVLDFGLAKSQQDDTITSSQVVMGSPAYMAPEQRAGKACDARTDIYALGLVLYEMATGQRPPQDRPAPLDNLPDGLAHVIQSCLDKDPEQRWQSARDIRAELDWLAKPKMPASFPVLTPITHNREKWVWVTAALVFASLLVVLTFIHFREIRPVHSHFKFQINAPPGELAGFTLSPDGRFLALVTTEGLTRKIWIRSLDGLDSRLLTEIQADKESSGTIFWSLDGENVAFQSQGKLYKIHRNGGPPVELTEAHLPVLGGVWLDRGTILFGTADGLFRASSSGGSVPVMVDQQRASAPAWLPGGHFLYVRANGIFVGSLDGAKPFQILPDSNAPAYVPPLKAGLAGHLLFVRGKTLLAQLFNADRLELEGEAIPIALRVGNLGLSVAFSASANGVLVSGRGDAWDVILTWLDRTGKRVQTVSTPFNLDINPAIRLSPDDSRAIVPIAGANGTDLWMADLNRNILSRFTFHGSRSGIWSPDGKRVLWAANDGNRYLRSADGSGKDELFFKNPTCTQCYPTDWSPNGKLIVFGEPGQRTNLDLWLVPTQGDRKPYPYIQSEFATYWAQFSPDSRWVAYGYDQFPQVQVFIESIPAGKGRWQVSTEGGNWPIWSRAGKELFYVEGNKIMAVSVRLTESSVESGRPQALFAVPSETSRFQVSRDGRRFLIALPVEGVSTSMPLTVDTDWRVAFRN